MTCKSESKNDVNNVEGEPRNEVKETTFVDMFVAAKHL